MIHSLYIPIHYSLIHTLQSAYTHSYAHYIFTLHYTIPYTTIYLVHYILIHTICTNPYIYYTTILIGVVEKQSLILNRNAQWKKKQRISILPKYLCIHFMRFFWKPTPESRDHTGLKCKILRAVTFPDVS